MQNVNALQ